MKTKYDVDADYKKLGFDGLNQKWLVFESEYWIWALRVSTVTLGSAILALKRPCTDMTQLTQEERDDQHRMHKLIRDIMFECFGAVRMNYMNLLINGKGFYFADSAINAKNSVIANEYMYQKENIVIIYILIAQ